MCADCGSTVKTEWCSINLAVIICIGALVFKSDLICRMQRYSQEFGIAYIENAFVDIGYHDFYVESSQHAAITTKCS
jgi:hypothetical protein